MDFSNSFDQATFFFAHARTRVYRSGFIAFAFSLIALASLPAAADLTPALQQAVADAGNADLDTCLPAIQKLGASKSPDAVTPLATAFSAEQRSLVRRYIVNALGSLQNMTALPTLKLALQDSDNQVRLAAVSALGLLSGPAVDDALIQAAAQEKDPSVKASIAYQLQWSADPRASGTLQTLSNDADSNVKNIAQTSLNAQQSNKPVQKGAQ